MSTPILGPVGVQVPSITWGRGYTDIRPLPSPSAGTGTSVVVPSSEWIVPLAITATLTTSATAADRYPTLSYGQGDGLAVATFAASTAITASATAVVTWAWGSNIPGGGGGLAPTIPLSEIILQSGWEIIIGVNGIDAADQLSALWLTALRIPTGPQGPPSGAYPVGATDTAYGAGTTVEVYTT